MRLPTTFLFRQKGFVTVKPAAREIIRIQVIMIVFVSTYIGFKRYTDKEKMDTSDLRNEVLSVEEGSDFPCALKEYSGGLWNTQMFLDWKNNWVWVNSYQSLLECNESTEGRCVKELLHSIHLVYSDEKIFGFQLNKSPLFVPLLQQINWSDYKLTYNPPRSRPGQLKRVFDAQPTISHVQTVSSSVQ